MRPLQQVQQRTQKRTHAIYHLSPKSQQAILNIGHCPSGTGRKENNFTLSPGCSEFLFVHKLPNAKWGFNMTTYSWTLSLHWRLCPLFLKVISQWTNPGDRNSYKDITKITMAIVLFTPPPMIERHKQLLTHNMQTMPAKKVRAASGCHSCRNQYLSFAQQTFTV